MEEKKALRVYLVDDEILIAESLAGLLQKKLEGPVEVRFFTDPEELLSAFGSEPCDLLISDIRMPGMTGLDMLRKLHAISSDFEVIFLTGFDLFEYAYESIQENTFGYLLKNESDDRVLELVRKALEKIRSRRKFETFFPQSGSWTESEGPRPKRITGQVKEYVLEHMGDDLSAGAIAEIVGYSEAHLSRLFRESEGITLHSFIQQVRMDRACHLLRDTNEKIYRIGEVCGYRNTAYFIRVFRSAMGITPQEFRDGKDK